MGYKEHTYSSIEKRKETAEKRGPLLDSIERNRTPPRNPSKSPISIKSSTFTETPGPPPNTPAEATPDTGSKKSIQMLAGRNSTGPTTEKPEGPANPNAGKKGGQKLVEDDLAESHNTLDQLAHEKKTSTKAAKGSIFGYPKNHPNFSDLVISSSSCSHPKMVLFTSDPNEQSQMVATKFKIQGNKATEIPDRVGQKFWNDSMELYSRLPASMQSTWAMKNMCSLEEETNNDSSYGNETHCLVEFRDLGVRYSFQFYRGICTWYIKFLDDGPSTDSMEIWGSFPPGHFVPQKKIIHTFYRNTLVPRTHWDSISCEALARPHWELQHKDCHHGHFRVNIYVNAKRHESPRTMSANDKPAIDIASLLDPHAKFTSHRVCGHALVADLFRAMGGSVDGRNGREPEDWQCLSEVLFIEKDENLSLALGKSYSYGMLKTQGRVKTMMVDTMWFRDGREYVWLLPTKKNSLGIYNLDYETRPNPGGEY